jgi:hypothetical protein
MELALSAPKMMPFFPFKMLFDIVFGLHKIRPFLPNALKSSIISFWGHGYHIFSGLGVAVSCLIPKD